MASDRLNMMQLMYGASSASYQLDASTKATANIYRARQSGTITSVILFSSRIGTAPTYRVGIESVSSRLPSGTYLASGAAYVDAANPNGAQTLTLGSSVTVAEGDLYAVTVRYQTGTINGSNCIFASDYHNTEAFYHLCLPWAVRMTAGSWGSSSLGFPRITPVYNDGSIEAGATLHAQSGLTTNSWSSSGSPLYRGSGMTMAATKRCVGVWVHMTPSASSSFSVKLFKDGTTSPLATRTVDVTNEWFGSGSRGTAYIPLTPTICASGSTYYWVIEPTTTNAITILYHLVWSSSVAIQNICGTLFGATGVSGSPPTWTQYNNSTDGFRSYMVVPDFDDVTAGGNPQLVNGGLIS